MKKEILFTDYKIPDDMSAKDLFGLGSIHELMMKSEEDEFSEEFFVRGTIRKKMMNE